MVQLPAGSWHRLPHFHGFYGHATPRQLQLVRAEVEICLEKRGPEFKSSKAFEGCSQNGFISSLFFLNE